MKKIHNVLRGENVNYYSVILGCNSEATCYNIILATKSIKIVNQHGRLVAEVNNLSDVIVCNLETRQITCAYEY